MSRAYGKLLFSLMHRLLQSAPPHQFAKLHVSVRLYFLTLASSTFTLTTPNDVCMWSIQDPNPIRNLSRVQIAQIHFHGSLLPRQQRNDRTFPNINLIFARHAAAAVIAGDNSHWLGIAGASGCTPRFGPHVSKVPAFTQIRHLHAKRSAKAYQDLYVEM